MVYELARRYDEMKEEYQALLRAVRAAEKYRWGRPNEELWNELLEALEALPEHLRGE